MYYKSMSLMIMRILYHSKILLPALLICEVNGEVLCV